MLTLVRSLSDRRGACLPACLPVRLSLLLPASLTQLGGAGDVILIRTEDGSELEIEVPEGVSPGDTFLVTLRQPDGSDGSDDSDGSDGSDDS
eukprot:COSAG03_NODE_14953_length_446_cov_0.685879_2_plen_91_part_01